MNIKVTGLDEIRASLAKWPEVYQDTLRKTLIIFGNKMVRRARGDHDFNRDSGEADKAIRHKVPKKNVVLEFFIEDKRTKSGKYNYPEILHEGSGRGYRKSKSAKAMPHKTPKKGFGILADHFMDRSWDFYYKKMVKRLVLDFDKAAKKVNLK